MRIIIEIEPGSTQAMVETETTGLKNTAPLVSDGGPPAQYLLDALGEVVVMHEYPTEEQPAFTQLQDAGAVPSWLTEAIDS